MKVVHGFDPAKHDASQSAFMVLDDVTDESPELLAKFRKMYPNLLKLGGPKLDRSMRGIISSITDTAPNEPAIKVSFTLPTFEEKKGHDVRKAEVTIEAADCHGVTITASGKRYHLRHKDFVKAAEWIAKEYC